MSSKLAVINGAFTHIGKETSASLSTASKWMTAALAVYEEERDALLSLVTWRFAVTKAALSRFVDAPLNEWSYQFQIPSDCLRILGTYPGARYEVYGDRIYSNHDTLQIDYVARVDEGQWPAHFVRVCSLSVAERICLPVTGDQNLLVTLNQMKRIALTQSMGIDAQQRPNTVIRSNPLIDVRHAN